MYAYWVHVCTRARARTHTHAYIHTIYIYIYIYIYIKHTRAHTHTRTHEHSHLSALMKIIIFQTGYIKSSKNSKYGWLIMLRTGQYYKSSFQCSVCVSMISSISIYVLCFAL